MLAHTRGRVEVSGHRVDVLRVAVGSVCRGAAVAATTAVCALGLEAPGVHTMGMGGVREGVGPLLLLMVYVLKLHSAVMEQSRAEKAI